MIKTTQKETIIQFIKFGIVGLFNTILSYGITNACYYILHWNEQISNIIAFVITVFISFLLNSKYVFNNKEENKSIEKEDNQCFWKPLLKVYASYSITGIFLAAILLYVEEQKLGIPHYIATLINLVVTVPTNFVLNKFWAYRNNNKSEGDNNGKI